jgi:hypothetical protein
LQAPSACKISAWHEEYTSGMLPLNWHFDLILI